MYLKTPSAPNTRFCISFLQWWFTPLTMGKLNGITKALKNTISEPTARPSLTLSVNLTWMFDSCIHIQRLT